MCAGRAKVFKGEVSLFHSAFSQYSLFIVDLLHISRFEKVPLCFPNRFQMFSRCSQNVLDGPSGSFRCSPEGSRRFQMGSRCVQKVLKVFKQFSFFFVTFSQYFSTFFCLFPSLLHQSLFLIQVFDYLLQQWVQTQVQLTLFEQLNEVNMVRDNLPQVTHLLQQFREQVWMLGMPCFKLKFQRVEASLLETLNGCHIQEAWTV